MQDVHLQAFADDFALVVSANNRILLERLCPVAVEEFTRLVSGKELKIASNKTQIVYFGPKKASKKPLIKVGGQKIKLSTSVRYLGVEIDNRLSWIPHMKQLRIMAVRATHRLMALRAGNWGVSPNLMRLWYTMVIEKRLLYGAAVWGEKLPFSAKRFLMTTMRPFLLLITKAYRTTSTEALLVLAAIPPITLTAERVAKAARLIRLGYDVPPHLNRDYDKCVVPPLLHPAKKWGPHGMISSVNPNGIKIFTDGSLSQEGIGAAFVAFRGKTVIDCWARKLRPGNSIFQAELVAIREAVAWVKSNSNTGGCILTDSQSCVAALNSKQTKSGLVQQVAQAFTDSEEKISLVWVQAHSGVLGNEAADLLARYAASAPHTQVDTTEVPLPWSHLKKVLRKEELDAWQTRWDLSEKGRGLYEFVPKVPTKMPFSNRNLIIFFSGHGPFPGHLFDHSLLQCDKCACGERGSPLHYLLECPLTSSWHMAIPSSVNKETWMHTLAANPKGFPRLLGLMKFLTENEHLLRAPVPDLPSQLGGIFHVTQQSPYQRAFSPPSSDNSYSEE